MLNLCDAVDFDRNDKFSTLCQTQKCISSAQRAMLL